MMGTIIVGGVLFGVVILIIRNMVKDMKKGKNPICGGDCSCCHGACHTKK